MKISCCLSVILLVATRFIRAFGSSPSCSAPAGSTGQVCVNNGLPQSIPTTESCIAFLPELSVCSNNGFLNVGSKSCVNGDSFWGNCCDNPMGLTVGEESCTLFGACSGNNGTVIVKDNSCIGDNFLTCFNNSNSLFVGSGSCHGFQACFRNTGPLLVRDGSCLAHFDIPADDTVAAPDIVDRSPCAFNRNGVAASIGNGSCKGSFPCLFNAGSFVIGDESCISFTDGVGELVGSACSSNRGTGGFKVGHQSCNADRACFANRDVSFTIGNKSCNKYFACRTNNATFTIGDESCKFNSSCSFNQGGPTTTFHIAEKSCNANNACSNNTASIIVGKNSCNGVGACRFISNTVVIGDNACNGAGACNSCTQSVRSGGAVCV